MEEEKVENKVLIKKRKRKEDYKIIEFNVEWNGYKLLYAESGEKRGWKAENIADAINYAGYNARFLKLKKEFPKEIFKLKFMGLSRKVHFPFSFKKN